MEKTKNYLHTFKKEHSESLHKTKVHYDKHLTTTREGIFSCHMQAKAWELCYVSH